jgi:hypothetical protein
VHSRKIEIRGADTVMTFDGNNEIAFEINLGMHKDWDGKLLDAYLKVCSEKKTDDCIRFANNMSSEDSANGLEKIHIGKFVMDSRVEASAFLRALPIRNSLKKNAPFIQRERHNAIIRDGEKRYKVNGATLR